LLAHRAGPLATPELLSRIGARSMSGALKKPLDHLTTIKLIEFTIPDKPRSKMQKRRLTPLGERVVQRLTKPTSR
jgi:ATP-dependent DNA helicase RecG